MSPITNKQSYIAPRTTIKEPQSINDVTNQTKNLFLSSMARLIEILNCAPELELETLKNLKKKYTNNKSTLATKIDDFVVNFPNLNNALMVHGSFKHLVKTIHEERRFNLNTSKKNPEKLNQRVKNSLYDTLDSLISFRLLASRGIKPEYEHIFIPEIEYVKLTIENRRRYFLNLNHFIICFSSLLVYIKALKNIKTDVVDAFLTQAKTRCQQIINSWEDEAEKLCMQEFVKGSLQPSPPQFQNSAFRSSNCKEAAAWSRAYSESLDDANLIFNPPIKREPEEPELDLNSNTIKKQRTAFEPAPVIPSTPSSSTIEYTNRLIKEGRTFQQSLSTLNQPDDHINIDIAGQKVLRSIWYSEHLTPEAQNQFQSLMYNIFNQIIDWMDTAEKNYSIQKLKSTSAEFDQVYEELYDSCYTRYLEALPDIIKKTEKPVVRFGLLNR